MSTGSYLLAGLRRRLKRVPGAVLLWRRMRYEILRLVGRITYPIIGCRAPLRGYYSTTREFLRHGNGYCAGLNPVVEINNAQPSDEVASENFVAVIPRGRSLYESGVIVSPDHRLLGDVSWCGYGRVSEPRYHAVMNEVSFPPIERIPGRVAIVSSIEANNYYHWMFDILPRFEMLQKSGLVPDYYFINTEAHFQRESLQVLRIPSDRILNPTKSTHIEADELVVPSLLGPVFCLSPQLQACKYLKSTFLHKGAMRRPHRKLYISRADARSRRVLNEPEIVEEVLACGFEVLSLSNIPFLEQIALFSEAAIVVGPHGAGFTNAVFCQPGSVLIEFLPEGWVIDCFERLARLTDMNYHSVVGTRAAISNDGGLSHDHVVDKAELMNLIRRLV